MPLLEAVCDRISISNRSPALIALSVLQGMGIISEQDQSSIIDHNKISGQIIT